VFPVAKDTGELQEDGHPDALSITQLLNEVEGTIARAFPRSRHIWVRGEIQTLNDRTGHCYIDLVDPEARHDRQPPMLKVVAWRTTWGPMQALLRREGLALEPGMVVVLRGKLEFYRPRSSISFVLDQIDVTALLGRLAAERAALLRALAAEGLLEANRRLAVPAVTQRLALVASPGTEGYHDFLGQLERSGFAFDVSLVRTRVQGDSAPVALARGIARAARSACDLVVIVRGGGSKADLVAFDAEPVARAIAGSPVPVWTGIGHTGDESVADMVANRSFVTPTECGRELVARLAGWWDDEVVRQAELVVRRAVEVLGEAETCDAAARTRLVGAARRQLDGHGERLGVRLGAVAALAPAAVSSSRESLAGRAGRLPVIADRHVHGAVERLDGFRRLLAAYDVERQLERGYTITTDADGRTVRTVADLSPGTEIVTRLADGRARSVVAEVSATDGGGAS